MRKICILENAQSVKLQTLELVGFVLVHLAGLDLVRPPLPGQSVDLPLLRTAIAAAAFHLLPSVVDLSSPSWSDAAVILLVHPKVHMLVYAMYHCVLRAVQALEDRLTVCREGAEDATFLAEQLKVSLEALQGLSQQKNMRYLVATHRRVGVEGELLQLVLRVLRLQCTFSNLQDMLVKLKCHALSLLLLVCDMDEASYLDEVAGHDLGLASAEAVIAEVVVLLRSALCEDPRAPETTASLSHLHLLALRMVDVLSDDSNFRHIVMKAAGPIIAEALADAEVDFASRWCGGEICRDFSAPVEVPRGHEPFEVLQLILQGGRLEELQAVSKFGASVHKSGGHKAGGSSVESGEMQDGHLRSILLVKLLGNLQCWNVDLCPDAPKDEFVTKLLAYLEKGPFQKGHPKFLITRLQTAVKTCENLHLLVDFVSSLPASDVSDDDLLLVSQLAAALHLAICPVPSGDAETRKKLPHTTSIQDAHRQKLRELHRRWQMQDRWQRVEQLGEVIHVEDNERQTAAGVLASEEEQAHALDGDKEHRALGHSYVQQVDSSDEEEDPEAGGTTPEEASQGHSDGLDGVSGKSGPETRLNVNEVESPVLQKEKLHGTPVHLDAKELQETAVHEAEKPDAGKPTLIRRDNLVARAREAKVKDVGTEGRSMRKKRLSEVNEVEEVGEDEKRREGQRKRRKKWKLLSDEQEYELEQAVQEEPDMYRMPKLVKIWTTKLQDMGSEINEQQLKNWINNRKAKLLREARAAAAVSPALDSVDDESPRGRRESVDSDPNSRREAPRRIRMLRRKEMLLTDPKSDVNDFFIRQCVWLSISGLTVFTKSCESMGRSGSTSPGGIGAGKVH
eukprot:SM000157S02081  [mRNA]  locus=s157:87608:94519:- [translate_table: standard]